MGRKKTRRKPLGTIWEVPDALWQRIEPTLVLDEIAAVGQVQHARRGRCRRRERCDVRWHVALLARRFFGLS